MRVVPTKGSSDPSLEKEKKFKALWYLLVPGPLVCPEAGAASSYLTPQPVPKRGPASGGLSSSEGCWGPWA